MRWTRTLVLSLAVGLLACGDDGSEAPDAGGEDASATPSDAEPAADLSRPTDAAIDAGRADAEGSDLGEDTGPRTGPCADRLYDDRNIPLDALGPTTQIHPSVAYDGDTLWVAYNLPNEQGFFDPYLTRLRCDGEVVLPPVRVTTTVSSSVGPNSIDPDLLLAHGQVYVFWQWDTGRGVDNMDIVYRRFDLEGAPLDAEDRVLVLERDGRPQLVSTWFPKIAPLPDGIALVGAWAHDQAQRFQVFVQRLGVDGSPTEEAIDVDLRPTLTQLYPSVATSSAGAVLVAWQEEPDDGDPRVRYGWLAPGARSLTQTATVGGFPSVGPQVSISDGEAVLGLTRALGSQARPELRLLSSAYDQPLGNPNRFDHTPVAARAPGGGAVFHLRRVQGIRNQVVFVPFSIGGGVIAPSAERAIETASPAAPYEPAILTVSPGLYFLAWSEGQSPDLRLFGRFVRSSP